MATTNGDKFNPLEMHNSGARVPALRLTKTNPKAAAMMSKLTLDQRQAARSVDPMNEQGTGVNLANLRGVAQEGMQNVSDSETIRQLLSETDLAASILVSVVLSPKDMVGIEVNYHSNLSHWRMPHEVMGTLTNSVRKYFDEVYKIKPRLPGILEDILFRRGCYPVAVLPENAVDDLIHGNGSISMESISSILKQDGQIQSLGLLGPTDAEKDAFVKAQGPRFGGGVGLALEHLLTHNPNKDWKNEVAFRFPDAKDAADRTLNTGITVTDNIGVLKMPLVSEKIRRQKISKIMGRSSALSAESISRHVKLPAEVSTESSARRVSNVADMSLGLRTTQIVGQAFRRPHTSQVVVKEVKAQSNLKRRSVGMPLEIHFPSESVIPVHVPNQPHKQIGFFVLLDSEGNPINRGQGVNHYRQLGASLQSNSFSSSMIARAGSAMSDNSTAYSQGNHYANAAQLYGNMLQRDLTERLRNGLAGKNVAISGHEEVYSLMLARSMSNQYTQILYIPVEYMTYMALEYNSNGTGRSLLENTKIIDSMQANMLVGTVMGALRNAVGRTHVDIELDEHTPDPWKAIEQVVGEMQRVNSNGFPLGTINPLDIKDGLQRSMFEFSFSGHPKLPNMKIDYSEKNSNYQPPDGTLMEDLRKRRLMSFWLTPEMVDAAVGADFAASVANNSTLLSKRAMIIQQEFTPQVSAHLRKHAINAADLIEELVEVIHGAFDEILKEFDDAEEIEMFAGEVVTKEELKTNALVKVQFIREMIEDFLGGFTMTLPEPDTTKVKNLGELYGQQSQLVEECMKAWISDDMMDDKIVGPELAQSTRIAAAQMKSYMLRDWQMKNGLMPELAAMTALNEEGDLEVNIAEIQAVHNEAIIGLLTTLITANKKAKEKAAKELEKAGITTTEPTDSYGSDTSTGGDSGMGDGGDAGGFDMGGGGDFDFDMGGAEVGGAEGGVEGETAADDVDPNAEPVEGEPAADDAAAEEAAAEEASAAEATEAEEAEAAEAAKKAEEEETKKKEEEAQAKADADKDDKPSTT
jgi:hypothetical protein